MRFLTNIHQDRAVEIQQLFETTFTVSEGASEGRLIGGLVGDLMLQTPKEDLLVYVADDEHAVGCVMFSRLRFDAARQKVFLLSPVAVAPYRQGQGIGQELLRHGLSDVAMRGADVAVTYGDPNYYSKVGFAPVSTEELCPPFPLSMPHGWLAQSMNTSDFAGLDGPSRPVTAFQNPDYW